ncbi:MAG TPA: BamA/TamA family outer membrane protein [Cytophagaceae bacterium]|nr:BamA/TamA family outer membrane protein [Cytophagaceae bacterium]
MKVIYYFFFICATIAFLLGCSNTRHLKSKQYLLYQQSVKGNKKIANDVLLGLIKQKPNRNFLGTLPYLTIYYIGKSHFDTAQVRKQMVKTSSEFDEKIKKYQAKPGKVRKLTNKKGKKLDDLTVKYKQGNWVMRVPGEAPSIFDSAQANLSLRQLRFYYHSKGFFQSQVTSSFDTVGKKVFAKYSVKEGAAYTIKNINYKADTAILRLITENTKSAKITAGENYDEEKISAERERINKLMKDNGYFDFSRQYIFFEIDTIAEKQKVGIGLIIKDPPGGTHEKYTVGKVIFNTDVATDNQELRRDTLLYKGIYFVYFQRNFSPKILTYKNKIVPGNIYSQSAVQNTQKQLAALDQYKFININFEKNKTDTVGHTLTAFIHTSPLKRYQITDEFGLNVSQGFVPGPFGNLTFKQRNTFKGFEILEVGIRYSITGQAAVSNPGQVYRTQEYGINAGLTFPQFFFPTKIRYKFYDYSPKTKIIAGYNIVNRPEYTRSILKAALNYTWNPSSKVQYTFAPIDINIINTSRITPEFQNYLDTLHKKGNNLSNSFRKSFVSNINLSYVFNNGEFGSNKKSRYIRLYVESGGTTLNFIDKTILNNNDILFGLKAFRYIKLNTEFRFYFPVSKNNTFALRFNFGYVNAYAGTHTLPYEKYFFTGGTNSNRAWKPRRLGPGTYADKDANGNIIYTFEKPGEILFENNYEFRHKLFGFVKGGAFIDMGNVWTLRNDPARPGSRFHSNNFLSQIAVGAGYGLRLDFSFLILRFDIGVKMWDPAQEAGKKLVAKNLNFKHPLGAPEQAVYNIGIGYPF